MVGVMKQGTHGRLTSAERDGELSRGRAENEVPEVHYKP